MTGVFNAGVVITDVEPASPADDENLEPGDVIVEVEHNQIKGLNDLRRYIESYKKQKTLLLTVRQKAIDYQSIFVVLKKKG